MSDQKGDIKVKATADCPYPLRIKPDLPEVPQLAAFGASGLVAEQAPVQSVTSSHRLTGQPGLHHMGGQT